MTSRPGMCLKLTENSTFLTAMGMAMVLMTTAVVVVGMGLSSAHMWLILAVVSLAWLSFCRCINWQKKVTTVERPPHLDTISSGLDNAQEGREPRVTPPPTYDSLTTSLDQPPSYSSVLAKMTPTGDQQVAPPPPYDCDDVRANKDTVLEIK